MAGPVILIGDKTTHGGTVLEAAPASFHGGIPIARLGDKVSCPIHGSGTIATGDLSCIVDGKPVARKGDKTSCGALLIPRQLPTIDKL